MGKCPAVIIREAQVAEPSQNEHALARHSAGELLPYGWDQWHHRGFIRNFSSKSDRIMSNLLCPLAPGETKTYTFLCTQFGYFQSVHGTEEVVNNNLGRPGTTRISQ